MKKFSFFLVAVFGTMSLHAQNVINATVTAGGSASGSAGISNFMIGQPFGGTLSGSGGTMYQGSLASIIISTATGVDEAIGITLTCKVYPNPTTDYIYLSVKEYDIKNLQYSLHDVSGRILEKIQITSDVTQIAMSNMHSGIYLVSINDNGSAIKKFKIIKK